jgi:hypothetical protein
VEAWSDEQLLIRTREAPAAFGVFFRRHEASVRAYFLRRVRDPELADELTAETFAAALLDLRGARGDAVAWLYGIARERLTRALEGGRAEDGARRRLALSRVDADTLEAAARQRHAGRRPARRRLALSVLALATAGAGIALVATLAPRVVARGDGRGGAVTNAEAAGEPDAAGAPLVVPGETLARSKVLVAGAGVLPAGREDDRERVPHAELPAVAAEIATRVPYPPETFESMNWASLPADPLAGGSVNFRSDVQFLVEYRAACTWAAFWLFAHQAGAAAALESATAVLQDIPHWPTLRGALDEPYERTVGWPRLARASAAGEVTPVRQYASVNCASVSSPYTAAIR